MAKKKSPGNSVAMAMPEYREPKSVTVKKAGNGFVLEQHSMNGSKCMVAKNKSEVQRHMNKLLKG